MSCSKGLGFLPKSVFNDRNLLQDILIDVKNDRYNKNDCKDNFIIAIFILF